MVMKSDLICWLERRSSKTLFQLGLKSSTKALVSPREKKNEKKKMKNKEKYLYILINIITIKYINANRNI